MTSLFDNKKVTFFGEICRESAITVRVAKQDKTPGYVVFFAYVKLIKRISVDF